MNRSFISVIAGGFGIEAGPAGDTDYGEHREIDAAGAADLLREASSVVITPGYGMAVAQAQYPVADLVRRLRERGVDVRFGIHPVAGRLPGHMNVLLAEAKVPVRHRAGDGRDQRRPRPPPTSCSSSAPTTPSTRPPRRTRPRRSPACRCCGCGRPRHVVVFKRSMAAGYAGVQNPLFFRDNTQMLFGDAKVRVEDIVSAL